MPKHFYYCYTDFPESGLYLYIREIHNPEFQNQTAFSNESLATAKAFPIKEGSFLLALFML